MCTSAVDQLYVTSSYYVTVIRRCYANFFLHSHIETDRRSLVLARDRPLLGFYGITICIESALQITQASFDRVSLLRRPHSPFYASGDLPTR